MRDYQVFGPPHSAVWLSRRIYPVGNIDNIELYHKGEQVDPRDAKRPIVIYGPNGPRTFDEPKWEVFT